MNSGKMAIILQYDLSLTITAITDLYAIPMHGPMRELVGHELCMRPQNSCGPVLVPLGFHAWEQGIILLPL